MKNTLSTDENLHDFFIQIPENHPRLSPKAVLDQIHARVLKETNLQSILDGITTADQFFGYSPGEGSVNDRPHSFNRRHLTHLVLEMQNQLPVDFLSRLQLKTLVVTGEMYLSKHNAEKMITRMFPMTLAWLGTLGVLYTMLPAEVRGQFDFSISETAFLIANSIVFYLTASHQLELSDQQKGMFYLSSYIMACHVRDQVTPHQSQEPEQRRTDLVQEISKNFATLDIADPEGKIICLAERKIKVFVDRLLPRLQKLSALGINNHDLIEFLSSNLSKDTQESPDFSFLDQFFSEKLKAKEKSLREVEIAMEESPQQAQHLVEKISQIAREEIDRVLASSQFMSYSTALSEINSSSETSHPLFSSPLQKKPIITITRQESDRVLKAE